MPAHLLSLTGWYVATRVRSQSLQACTLQPKFRVWILLVADLAWYTMTFESLTPDDLIGPLNDVETRYAPKLLYIAGNREIVERGARVSIVGSRKASTDGLSRARRLASILTENGMVVVSGLAEGIDTAAHTSAIDNNGRTIAVIGTPLDKCYPKKNKPLQDTIQEHHLCVSQFPSGFATRPYCFPQRNRTMALMSDATVIIEASDTSGSLSQGWEALRLGRGLFIAQSVAEDARLSWPEKLIGHGAQILSDATIDVLLDSLPDRDNAEHLGELAF